MKYGYVIIMEYKQVLMIHTHYQERKSVTNFQLYFRRTIFRIIISRQYYRVWKRRKYLPKIKLLTSALLTCYFFVRTLPISFFFIMHYSKICRVPTYYNANLFFGIHIGNIDSKVELFTMTLNKYNISDLKYDQVFLKGDY